MYTEIIYVNDGNGIQKRTSKYFISNAFSINFSKISVCYCIMR